MRSSDSMHLPKRLATYASLRIYLLVVTPTMGVLFTPMVARAVGHHVYFLLDMTTIHIIPVPQRIMVPLGATPVQPTTDGATVKVPFCHLTIWQFIALLSMALRESLYKGFYIIRCPFALCQAHTCTSSSSKSHFWSCIVCCIRLYPPHRYIQSDSFLGC